MGLNLNKVMLAGNLTRDPEIKYTPKGTAVGELGLAVNHRYTTGQGEKREEAVFVDVEVWGKTAEIIGEHCKKGHTIYIEGRLKLDQWDDKATGQKRSKIRVVCEEFKFVSSPRDGDEAPKRGNEPRNPGRQTPPERPPCDPDLDVSDDDIPF